MATQTSTQPVTQPFHVYFDGLCVVCSKEIEFYRKKRKADAITWVDISAPGFDAKAEGLDPKEVQRVFHVREESGRLITGVDAFIEIWKRLPELSLWVRLAEVPGARAAMRLGYLAFVRVRPWLPRRASSVCADGYCER